MIYSLIFMALWAALCWIGVWTTFSRADRKTFLKMIAVALVSTSIAVGIFVFADNATSNAIGEARAVTLATDAGGVLIGHIAQARDGGGIVRLGQDVGCLFGLEHG